MWASELQVGLLVLRPTGDRLRGGQDLHEVPEERHVEVALGAVHREVVELLGGEPVEPVIGRRLGHAGHHRAAWPPRGRGQAR